ncbi:hypothetical protein AVEN_115387-1 [Araneus ventricosus]|uniref:Uncharacterized protein n=1 Tax=Araneus ventricosus TaxID=182803 RepID=A0A4Y1ZY98_ARAVE|nr:hypothetical protein AVEN_115387-1 [Araneus ventricosus]
MGRIRVQDLGFSLVISTSRFEATLSYFGTDLVILNHGQMTRATPPLQASTQHQREGVWLLRMIQRAAGPIHGGSSVESGFEPGTLRNRAEALPPGHRGLQDLGKPAINVSEVPSPSVSWKLRECVDLAFRLRFKIMLSFTNILV